MKKKQSREKAASFQEKDLAWVKGSSGYMIGSGDEGGGDPSQPPPNGNGGN
jgi:hypothetical protein